MSGEQRAESRERRAESKGPRMGAVYTRIVDVVNDAVDCRHFYIGNRLTNYLEIMQTSVKEILDMMEEGSLRRAESRERRAESMSQKQAKLIRKAFKVCPLLVAIYGKLLEKGYKAIAHGGISVTPDGKKIPKGPITIIAAGRRQIYQHAKGLMGGKYEK